MQNTSALYQQIVAEANHYFDVKVKINGVDYTADKIFSLTTDKAVLNEKPTIGGAIAGEIDLTILRPSVTIPKMAQVVPYIKACYASTVSTSVVVTESEWLQKGVYYIDTREMTHNDDGFNQMTIHGYDAIMFADQVYPSTNHNWPYSDNLVLQEIASTIGVSIDSRTYNYVNGRYMIDLPSSDYTMREVLGNIACAYCGNFVMTAEGKLLFVPLIGLDEEENTSGYYLSDENGNALTFGNEGWYILV